MPAHSSAPDAAIAPQTRRVQAEAGLLDGGRGPRWPRGFRRSVRGLFGTWAPRAASEGPKRAPKRFKSIVNEVTLEASRTSSF